MALAVVEAVNSGYLGPANRTSMAVTFAATPADGETILLICALDEGPTWEDLPTGFTVEAVDTRDGLLTVWSRVASSEASATYTVTGSNSWRHGELFGVVVSGGDATTVVEAVADTFDYSTTQTAPSVTTLTDEAWHLAVWKLKNSTEATAEAAPSGYTKIDGLRNCLFAHKTITPAGASGTATVTLGPANGHVSWSFALKPGAGGPAVQAVDLPTIAAASTLAAPTVTPQAVSLSLPHIAAGSTLSAPTVSAAASSVTLPTIAASSTLAAPTVTAQAATVTLPTIATAATLAAPTVTAAAVNLALPTIAASSTLATPTVTPQAVTVTLPAIASTSTLAAPTISASGATVALPTIAASSTLAAPTVTPQAATVTLPAIASTATVSAPTVAAAGVLVLPAIASTSVPYTPTVSAVAASVTLPTIGSTATLSAVTVEAQAVFATLPHIASVAVISSPRIYDMSGAPVLTGGSLTITWADVDRSTSWTGVDRTTQWADIDRSLTWSGA